MNYQMDRKIDAFIERKGSPEKALAYAKKAAVEVPTRAEHWEMIAAEIEIRHPNLV